MKYVLVSVLFFAIMLNYAVAQTAGTLTVTAITSSAGGNYAPRNVVAMWVEDDQGNFVKTLLAYAANRKTHLNTWEASTTAAGSPFNVVDAITGATQPNHSTRTCTWDGTDILGNVVADGGYRLRMELTDKNATGNFSSFNFTKDTLPVNLTPANVPSFSQISIAWEPVITTSVDEESLAGRYHVYPNPTPGIFRVEGDGVSEVRVVDADGKQVYAGKSMDIDISGQPDGIYYVRIMTVKHGILSKRILKAK